MNASRFALVALLALSASGCVVVPAHQGYVTPPGVVYVAPGYASPGDGYRWEHNGQYGWGWNHPQQGWHRGWR